MNPQSRPGRKTLVYGSEKYRQAFDKVADRLGELELGAEHPAFWLLSVFEGNSIAVPDDIKLCNTILELDEESKAFTAMITMIALAVPVSRRNAYFLRCAVYQLLGLGTPEDST